MDFWRRWRNKPKRVSDNQDSNSSPRELREFVYLDEVSLRSLLSSMTGDLREGRSSEAAHELQAEVAASLEVKNPVVGGAGLSSRFQTTNSSTIQTSRKATVQSWFRDFRAMPNLRLVEVAKPMAPALDIDSLMSTTDTSLLIAADNLARGELVEFRVQLAADPVYRLSTMFSEFAGMAEDYPEMFAAGNALDSLGEAGPVNKVLERLLAGLVPLRALSVDYRVITVEQREYIVHESLISNLDIASEPLSIVGLTEHLAYWKDLRRVLFSNAEFTLLGRVSRTGLHESWTPVKLVDLFQELVPDLAAQINSASLISATGRSAAKKRTGHEEALAKALRIYAASLCDRSGCGVDCVENDDVAKLILTLSERSASASGQRSAFSELRARLDEHGSYSLNSDDDLLLRDAARIASHLPLFPSLDPRPEESAVSPPTDSNGSNRLADVEIIAIYW
jgi:hypothetical protein